MTAMVRVEPVGSGRGGLAEAELRGHAATAQWIKDGLVVPGKQLAQAWGVSLQALTSATAKGQLVGAKIDGRTYYPSSFLSLNRESVGSISRAPTGVGESEALMFWLRGHGALGGMTVEDAMDGGALTAKVVSLAEAWASERSLAARHGDDF